MAKGQKRSTRELKKPKQKKPAEAITAAIFGAKKPHGVAPGKKKG